MDSYLINQLALALHFGLPSTPLFSDQHLIELNRSLSDAAISSLRSSGSIISLDVINILDEKQHRDDSETHERRTRGTHLTKRSNRNVSIHLMSTVLTVVIYPKLCGCVTPPPAPSLPLLAPLLLSSISISTLLVTTIPSLPRPAAPARRSSSSSRSIYPYPPIHVLLPFLENLAVVVVKALSLFSARRCAGDGG
jgi:hypothetical protein